MIAEPRFLPRPDGPLIADVRNELNALAALGVNEPPSVEACCNHRGGPVVLAEGPQSLALDGFFCSGGESQAWCNAPAYGQSVVATGVLVKTTHHLAHAVLCSE
jgi:hypothetical protein